MSGAEECHTLLGSSPFTSQVLGLRESYNKWPGVATEISSKVILNGNRATEGRSAVASGQYRF
jgi:hypothetical protein